eukprot:CAMPEP_0198333442 /NCGR_PEP_ID=MMETSP1450-20131203/18956_1 /TAXON_ID=753684 ORGANISM="Madagascaria erythrocladiodes, Strain CCMP3234" /NCGR_SAMPLE_ID=MMETSP1450 /ASSEMBLY_ACC=CAM_ASM_001115 /LENGTH=373 /DNA_ID=CAMNT_0044037961 /DNA_START=19 /DNA_END=1140 /DNA_ORIENTATION=+
MAEGSAASAGYKVKWVEAASLFTPICLQNQNGPCPLLAIANALFLRGDLDLKRGTTEISDEYLQSLMTEYLYRVNGSVKEGPEEWVANHQMNLADAVNMLPRLSHGMDVNVRFDAPDSFEFTREMSCFDLFRLRLLHGWLVHPQEEVLVRAMEGLSFNQLMDKLVAIASENSADRAGSSSETSRQQEAAILQTFLNDNAAQLTYHGLAELHTSVAEGEFFVFFRNNHFSTAMKRDGALYLLVSDQGYLAEPSVVWELLHGIGGESTFVDGNLREYAPSNASVPRNDGDRASRVSDAELVKQLKAQQRLSSGPREGETPDEALARKLQETELKRIQAAAQARAQNTGTPRRSQAAAAAAGGASPSPKLKDCSIQ